MLIGDGISSEVLTVPGVDFCGGVVGLLLFRFRRRRFGGRWHEVGKMMEIVM